MVSGLSDPVLVLSLFHGDSFGESSVIPIMSESAFRGDVSMMVPSVSWVGLLVLSAAFHGGSSESTNLLPTSLFELSSWSLFSGDTLLMSSSDSLEDSSAILLSLSESSEQASASSLSELLKGT